MDALISISGAPWQRVPEKENGLFVKRTTLTQTISATYSYSINSSDKYYVSYPASKTQDNQVFSANGITSIVLGDPYNVTITADGKAVTLNSISGLVGGLIDSSGTLSAKLTSAVLTFTIYIRGNKPSWGGNSFGGWSCARVPTYSITLNCPIIVYATYDLGD